MISGILASPGITFAKALLLEEQAITISTRKVRDVEKEIATFLAGRKKAALQLEAIKKQALETFGEEKEAIFEGHLMLLEDEELEDDISNYIKQNKCTADFAINTIVEDTATMLQELEDPYLRERAADFRDIGRRLLKNVLGITIVDLSNISEEVILIANDLTPSETAQINLKYVLGFITDIGGRTSHTSIMHLNKNLTALKH